MRKAADKGGKRLFAEHLTELRGRLAYCMVSLFVGAAVGYYYQEILVSFLLGPLNQPVFYSSPTGGFDFLFRTCIFFGFIVSVPVCVYNLLKFLEPMLDKPMRRRIILFVAASWLLVVTGIGFAYLVSLPATLNFLAKFSTGQIRSLISSTEYFSFLLVYLAGFAVIFQLPLILLFLNGISRLNVRSLVAQGRLVTVLAFVVSAIITPTPDPLNQTIMALPIIALYAVSVVLIAIVNRRPGRKVPRKRIPPPPRPPVPPPPRIVSDLRGGAVRR